MQRLGSLFLASCLAFGFASGCGESADDSNAATGGGAGSGTGGTSSGSGGDSSGGGTGGGAEVEVPDSLLGACRAYVMAQCLRREECAGTTSNRCAETADAYCPDLLFSEGSTRTLEGVLDCAAEWKTFSCDNALVYKLPDCVTPGTRQVGETCVYPSQCATQECSGNGTSCGVCLELAEPGGACSDTLICPPGEDCASGSCAPREPYSGEPAPVKLGEGEYCIAGDCEKGLTCVSNDARTDNVCRPVPEAGDDCYLLYFGVGNDGQVCSEWEDTGVYCDATELKCLAAPAAGEPCGVRDVGSTPVCAAGSYCNASGICEEPKGPGEPCLYSPALGQICADSVCDALDSLCKETRKLGESCGAVDQTCEEHTLCEDDVCVADDTLEDFSTFCE